MIDIWDFHQYHFHGYCWPPLIVGILLAFLGLTVMIRDRASIASLVFGLLTFTGTIWLLGDAAIFSSPDYETAVFWARVGNSGVVFIPNFLYLFAVVVLQRFYRYERYIWTTFLISFLFFVSIWTTDSVISGAYRYPWGFYSKYGPFGGGLFAAYFFCLVFAGIQGYWVEYHRSTSVSRRWKLKRLLIAFSIAALGAVDYFPAFGFPLYPFGYVPVAVFIVIIMQTIWRSRLVDITPSFAAEHIMHAMGDLLLVWDRYGIVRLANRAAWQFFESSPSKIIGDSIETLLKNPLFDPQRCESMTDKDSLRQDEITLKDSQGRNVVFNLSTSAIRDGNGEPLAFVSIGKDVTAYKQVVAAVRRAYTEMEQRVEDRTAELRVVNERLQRLDEMKSNFILAASHELRTPLTSIKGYISLILQEKVGAITDQQREFMSHVKTATDRLQRLLSELLSISKIESGQFVIKMETVRVEDLLKESATIYKAEADQKEIALNLHVRNELKTIECNADKIRELLDNMISNALKYTPQGGRVDIWAERGAEELRIRVQDTGIGIKKEEQDKIFDPFHHVHKTGLAGEESTGLGLALSMKIAKLHHGNIEVESEEGKGSVFTLTLPLKQPSVVEEFPEIEVPKKAGEEEGK